VVSVEEARQEQKKEKKKKKIQAFSPPKSPKLQPLKDGVANDGALGSKTPFRTTDFFERSSKKHYQLEGFVNLRFEKGRERI
jgi:hypothetical protein